VKMHDVPATASTEALESHLIDAYAVDIPPHLAARLERRVSAAIQVPQPSSSADAHPANQRRRRLALIPVLLAVAMVTAAAAGGVLHFYDEAGGLAWQRAEHLGLIKTVDGYRLTLERVYADANRMLVGVTVVDEQNRGWSQVGVDQATVTDSSGGRWEVGMGASSPEDASVAANLFWFDADPGPAAPGRRAFTVSIPSVSVRDQTTPPTTEGGPGLEEGTSAAPVGVDGTWWPWHEVKVDTSFSFDLTVDGGALATPHAAAESNGVTITLGRIVASPSTVRLELDVAGLPSGAGAWAPIMSIRHAGVDLAVMLTTSGGGPGTTNWTSRGVDDASGDWIVTVTEEVGDQLVDGTVDKQIRLQGPWIIHFTMP
jgi:hypothetical protein